LGEKDSLARKSPVKEAKSPTKLKIFREKNRYLGRVFGPEEDRGKRRKIRKNQKRIKTARSIRLA